MLTPQEIAALAAALPSKKTSAAKKAMEDETTTNVDVTVRLVGTSAKGKQGSTLKMMADMKAGLRKLMPTSQSQAAVSVAVDVQVIDSAAVRQGLAEAANTEKDEV